MKDILLTIFKGRRYFSNFEEINYKDEIFKKEGANHLTLTRIFLL